MECGGLHMLGPGNSTLGRCGLDGVGVTLLEEVCHCEGRLSDSPPSHMGDSLSPVCLWNKM